MEGPWVILPSQYYTLFLTLLHTLPLAALHTLPRRRRWGHLLTEWVKRPWLQRKVNIRRFCFFTHCQGPFFHISTPRLNVDVARIANKNRDPCKLEAALTTPLLLTHFCFWSRLELYLAPAPRNLHSGSFSFFWWWYFKNVYDRYITVRKVLRCGASPAHLPRVHVSAD